jgi:hypothetical protein
MRKLWMTMAGALATTVATSAHAEPTNVGVDITRVFLDLDAYARSASERPNPAATANVQSERAHQLYVQNAGNAWFGVAPSVTLVARDWGSAYRLAGDRLSLVDAMRLSESTRMVLSRVRLSNTRVTPFAQLGLGQWRTDPNLLPLMQRNTEVAGQLGGGVEIRLGGAWQIACESSATLLIRDEREAQNLPASKIWSTTFASRLQF